MKKQNFTSDFFKILKTDDNLKYLAKFVEIFFSKTHLNASKSAKNTSPTLQILLKIVLFYRKKTQQSPYKHFRFGRSKSPVKRLNLEYEFILNENLVIILRNRTLVYFSLSFLNT
jgi:hypothetical protein